MKILKTVKKYTNLPSRIMFVLCALCAPIYLGFRLSTSFAQFFNTNISPMFRFIYTSVSNTVPFSVVEFLLLASPLIVGYLCILVYKYTEGGGVKHIRLITSLIAAGAFVFVSFTVVYSPGYFGKTMEENLALDTSEITEDDLAKTFEILTENINKLCEENRFPTKPDGATLMPDSFGDTVSKVEGSYRTLHEEYPFFQRLDTVAKPIILSPLMTYTHIAGMYTYYTGEVNINTNYPDYIVVSTIAHEMAHQRGIAREDEANFSAFLVLTSSDDPYLQYSGYLDVYSTVGNALYETNPVRYNLVRRKLCDKANAELSAFSYFFDKYRDNSANKISESVNNAFLESQGTEGTVSYDLVTELVVGYYR